MSGIRDRTTRGARAGTYLLVSLVTGMAAMVGLGLVAVSAVTVAVGGLGLVLFPSALNAVRRWADWESRRAAALLGVELPTLHGLDPDGSGVGEPATGTLVRFRRSVADPATRRALQGLCVHALAGTAYGLAGLVAILTVPGLLVQMVGGWAIPLPGALFVSSVPRLWVAVPGATVQVALTVAMFWWAVPALARWDARLTLRGLGLSPADLEAARLAKRVDVLTQTRAGALDAHDAELRRIERDLHDGTQARLVSIAMRLGVAEQLGADQPELTAKLIREARGGAEDAMQELRDVIRTMYPPILADRGLDGALAALGARCPVPTTMDVGDLGRVPAPVEAAAYFVVAEALTNVAKHSAATLADVRVARDADRLVVEVTDDGLGGIDETLGTGVAGIRRRVDALDGEVRVDSPVGGPSSVLVELPCGS
ncbi:Signal transduction histidine kinase [Actinopolymorpha cephalotaxi]|uniref:histidine kinase n=1 Tax=Actinopolymorpha cephalotaxi TaxID=504797 RepID=A0A1I2Y1I6_9ACTN|nr:sensor histidine kinase [Actinopolymorpha cephalotaxi]NYH87275.1 signal transduction histidine kinase [Actinopolymorpha cephalotaxi]SFH19197.1 Signal transduction histidine kinase [Actinopolymorpha cephalotaxi]